MEINSCFDFIFYTVFTLSVLFIGVPLGIHYTFSALNYLIKFGFVKFPDSVDKSVYGKYPHEPLLLGLFVLIFSIWYLFFDRDGNIFYYFKEVKEFL